MAIINRSWGVLAFVALGLCYSVEGGLDWTSVTNPSSTQKGDATFYGQDPDQDAQGACSFNENYANIMSYPWHQGTMVTIALNREQFDNSRGCGLCIMYRGTGGGIGVTPLSTTQWTMGIVNNQCPECQFGDIDQNINGDGRWRTEWFAVPCNVGDSKITYKIVYMTEYWGLVIGNTRIPVDSVQLKIKNLAGDFVWVSPRRSQNNQWVWPGDVVQKKWSDSDYPMPIRITCVAGETVEDVITGPGGNDGSVQFSPIAGPTFVSEVRPGYGIQANNFPGFSNPSHQEGSTGFNAGLYKPDQAVGTEANTGVTYTNPTLYIEDGEQCGGKGGDCELRDVGQPTKPCVSTPWPMAVCKNPDHMCQPSLGEGQGGEGIKDSLIWRCSPRNGGGSTQDISTGGRKLLLA